jgi:hypothetical protein
VNRVNVVDNSNGARASGRSAKGGIKIAGTAPKQTAPAGIVSREERDRQREQAQAQGDAKGKGKARAPEVIDLDDSDDEDAGHARKKEGHEEDIEDFDDSQDARAATEAQTTGRSTDRPRSRDKSRPDGDRRPNSAERTIPQGRVAQLAGTYAKGNLTHDKPFMPDDSTDDFHFTGTSTETQKKTSRVSAMQSGASTTTSATTSARGTTGKGKGKTYDLSVGLTTFEVKSVEGPPRNVSPALCIITAAPATAGMGQLKFSFRRTTAGEDLASFRIVSITRLQILSPQNNNEDMEAAIFDYLDPSKPSSKDGRALAHCLRMSSFDSETSLMTLQTRISLS